MAAAPSHLTRLVAALDAFAPFSGAASWDNVGLLVEPPAAGSEHHEVAGSSLGLHVLHARDHRPRHEQHARAAAEWPVVHLAVHPFGEIADVHDTDVEESACARRPAR